MSRRSLLYLVGAGIGLMLVIGVAVVAAVEWRAHKRRIMRVETPAVLRSDLLARPPLVYEPLTPPTPTDRAEFGALFDRMSATAAAGDADGYAACYDSARTAEEILTQIARWNGKTPTQQRINRLAEILSGEIGGRIKEPDFQYRRTDLLGVSRAADGSHAQVLARHSFTVGAVPAVQPLRWWLVRGPDGWRAVDHEHAITRFRMSVGRAGTIWQHDAGLRPPPLDRGVGPAVVGADQDAEVGPVDAVFDALASAWFRPAYRVRNELARYPEQALPPPLAAARAVAEAMLRVREGDPMAAGPFLDEAARLDPTSVRIPLARAAAANAAEDFPAALDHLGEYEAVAGRDAPAVVEIGRALEGFGHLSEAADVYRAGTDDFPYHMTLYAGLLRVLPSAGAGEVGRRIAAAPDAEEKFQALLGGPEVADAAVADLAVTEYRRARPNSTAALAYAAAIRAGQGKPDAARDLYRQAREQPPSTGPFTALDFLLAGVERFCTEVAAYQVLPTADQGDGFRRLAATLEIRSRISSGATTASLARLKELIALHRAAQPSDAWSDFYEAELHAATKDFARAEVLFAAGLAKQKAPAITARKGSDASPLIDDFTDDEGTWDQFRARRADCLFKLGRWRDAYRELPPAVYTFDQLAFDLMEAKDAAGLAELVRLHRAAHPEDHEATLWQAEADRLRKDYAKAVEGYARYREAAGPAGRQRWRADENRVRVLVRLGRLEEARRVRAESDLVGNLFPLRAAIAAAAEDEQELLTVLAEWAAAGGDPLRFYEDEDVGPSLRADRFVEVRKKYPPSQ